MTQMDPIVFQTFSFTKFNKYGISQFDVVNYAHDQHVFLFTYPSDIYSINIYMLIQSCRNNTIYIYIYIKVFPELQTIHATLVYTKY